MLHVQTYNFSSVYKTCVAHFTVCWCDFFLFLLNFLQTNCVFLDPSLKTLVLYKQKRVLIVFCVSCRFYSSPYSISTNRMIAQTSITPFIAASPVSTYQVRSQHIRSIQNKHAAGKPTHTFTFIQWPLETFGPSRCHI